MPRNPANSTARNDHLWKTDQEWILLFDNLMKYSNRKKSGSNGNVSVTPILSRGHQYHPSVPNNPTPLRAADQESITNVAASQERRMPATSGAVHQSRAQGPSSRPKEMPVSSVGVTSSSNNVGGVEADNFIECFLDVPRIHNVVSGPAVELEMSKINQTLSDVSIDWSKRVDALKRVRSVVIAGGDIYKEFQNSLRFVDVSLISSVKDLRSQVVRETCVTLAFLSQQLGHKFDRTAEVTLPSLISLIPNSAKIMSTSGIVTIRFILQNTHSPKLVPIIVNHLQTSRSKEVRRYCCEFVKHVLFVWSKESLEKHAALLQDAIKRGICDADPEARALSRQAYWHFKNVFPNHAEALVNQLDPSNKKLLEEGRQGAPLQQAAASRSTPPRDPAQPRATPSRDPSCSRPPSRLRKHSDNETGSTGSAAPSRSSSAIDHDAARRARAKSSTPAPKQASTANILATPIRSRKTYGPPSTSLSRAQSPAVTPRKIYVSRSQAVSRDCSPEKLLPLSQSARKLSTNKPPGDPKGNKSQTDGGGYISDEDGDTSQYGSQASLSGQRYAYNVAEILTLLGSPNWSSRREGLLGLQKHLRTGTLYPADVDNVRLLLTRMMSDPTTKVFSLFLDTLFDFICAHKLDLGSWLYTLLTRLFVKMSVDLLPSVQGRIDKCFELIRGSFAAENQFQQLLKFVNDSLQTPNFKVKAAFLAYLVDLIKNNMAPSDFKNTSAVRIGVTKIVNWSLDAKTPELRKLSQNVLISLHELNAGEFTSMLALMDEYLRDTALKVIGSPLRGDGVDGNGNGRRSQSSSRNSSRSDLRPVGKTVSVTSPLSANDENMNPDDFYASLRQTTQAIEKFSIYSNLDYSSGDEGKRNPGSEDSGFSRHSLNANVTVDSEHSSQNEDLSASEATGNRSTRDDNTGRLLEGLLHLQAQLKNSDPAKWLPADCISIQKSLEAALAHSDTDVIIAGLNCILKCAQRGMPLADTIIPAVLDLQGDTNRNVADLVDKVLLKLTEIIPLTKVAHILAGQFLQAAAPRNTKAAMLLMQVIQRADRPALGKCLPEILPSVVQGFNASAEPNVRKECMLCIVDIQQKVGADAVSPYIRDLTVNKIKLLNLYLQRK